MYLYIIKKSQENVNFGKTLFWKILYFSDFDFYERFDSSITGDDYFRLPHGPAPSSFDQVISKLRQKKLVKEFKVDRAGNKQIRYFLTEDFEPASLSPEEKKEIERNVERLRGMTARQVSEYSHQDMPYKATSDGEQIDYELVFYRNPIFSVDQ